MTSSAAAAAQLANALSPSEQQLSELKEYADLCGIPANVVNKLTKPDFVHEAKLWKNVFTRTLQLLYNCLQSCASLESITTEQHAFYKEIMLLNNVLALYDSCYLDPAKMLQWVRGFSALWIVSEAMSQNGIKSGVFGGDEGVFHFGRPAWSGHFNKYENVLSSMNLLIKKMAEWAGVQQGKNQEVDDLILDARLANLQEDPIKLRGIDRLVQAFADEASRNIHAKLAPAGTKTCPGA
jgi:hypothetical protein